MNITSYSTANTKKKILLLSIPVFFANLAIPLVGLVDTGLMGNLGETKFIAATSIGSSVVTMLVWSFGFLRMGTVGIVAQLFAKSDYREIIRTLLRNFLIAIIISILIIVFKPLIIHLTGEFFSTSFETSNLVNTYISIRILSVPAEFIIYILIGFYLGIQKTTISSLLIITLSILNIIFSSLFVLTLDLNVFGVALGSFIASYLTAIIFSFFTYNFIVKKFQIIPTIQKIIAPTKFFRLITINFNLFLRTLVLTFSFLWISYMGAKLGEDFLAVNTILMQFIILSAFLLDAYAYTTEGIVGYSLGKKNKKSFFLAVKNSIELSFISALIISILYLIFFKEIINIITDIEILRYISYKHAIWIMIIPIVGSFCYQLDGIFIGASQTSDMRNATIFASVSFIVLSIYFTKYFHNHGLWLSLLLFMLLRSLSLTFLIDKITKKL